MYINKCTKCGKEFETKNPKRVICPDCLYPDRNSTDEQKEEQQPQQNAYPRSYSAGSENEGYKRPYNKDRNFQPRNNNGRPPQSNNRFRKPFNSNGGQRPSGGGYHQGGGGFKKPFNNRPRPQAKPLLISKEQLAQIEELYRKMLPLPNPDAHEVIAEKLTLEPKKVFFGINLIRQKMMLPKVNFPKRKLALSADQLLAIKNLYEPLLPLPPIGCHKILAAQLRMDEWRVHVGIGLVRKQIGLERWNPDREDAPEEYKKKK